MVIRDISRYYHGILSFSSRHQEKDIGKCSQHIKFGKFGQIMRSSTYPSVKITVESTQSVREIVFQHCILVEE